MLKPLIKKSGMKENYPTSVSKCPSSILFPTNRGTNYT